MLPGTPKYPELLFQGSFGVCSLASLVEGSPIVLQVLFILEKSFAHASAYSMIQKVRSLVLLLSPVPKIFWATREAELVQVAGNLIPRVFGEGVRINQSKERFGF